MKHKKLHKDLILNLLLMPLIVLLIGASINMYNVGRITDDLVTEQTNNTLDVLSHKVEHYLEHPASELDILEDLIKDNNESSVRLEDRFNKYFRYNLRFDIMNDQGLVLQSFPELESRIGFDLSRSDRYLVSSKNIEDLTLGKVIYDRDENETTFWISKRIGDQYIIGYLDLDVFTALLKDLSIDDGYVGIIDEKGGYVSHTNPLYVEQRVVDLYASDIRKGKITTGTTIDYNNADYRLLYRRIDHYDWYVVYYQDLSIVKKPTRSILSILIVVFSTLLMIILFFITRTVRVIDESVNGLMEVSSNIAAGNYQLVHQPFRYQEFEALFSSLRSMSNEVHTREEEISTLNTELDDNYYNLVVLLAKAIEAKDNYTGGHCERVRDLSMILSKGLEMTSEQLRQLKFGSTLHDIGKIGIPETILNKPGTFTDEEYEYVKKHSALGYDIMAELPSMHEAKEIILHHHERVDGNGYPYGLVAEEIPLLAKIVSIADAFDAMTSERPYKNSYMSHSEAFKELRRCSGTQFDTVLVEVFISQMKKNSVYD